MGYHLSTEKITATPGMTPQDALEASIGSLMEYYGSSVDGPSISHVKTFPATSSLLATKISYGHEDMGVETAAVIPVVADKDVTVKTYKRKVLVNAEEIAQLRKYHNSLRNYSNNGRAAYPDAANIVRSKVADEFPNVSSVEITSFPKAKKAAAVATEGASETVYLVMDSYNRQLIPTLFPTQAAARAAGVQLVNDGKADEVSVQAKIVRSTGTPELVRIARPEPETATLNVTVTADTVKPNSAVEYYSVAFYYHS